MARENFSSHSNHFIKQAVDFLRCAEIFLQNRTSEDALNARNISPGCGFRLVAPWPMPFGFKVIVMFIPMPTRFRENKKRVLEPVFGDSWQEFRLISSTVPLNNMYKFWFFCISAHLRIKKRIKLKRKKNFDFQRF